MKSSLFRYLLSALIFVGACATEATAPTTDTPSDGAGPGDASSDGSGDVSSDGSADGSVDVSASEDATTPDTGHVEEVAEGSAADTGSPDTALSDTDSPDTPSPDSGPPDEDAGPGGPPCCDFSVETCPDGPCINGFCLPGWDDGNKCFSSEDCPFIGFSCVGGVANLGSCQEGGSAPTVGTCEADGPGGFCITVTPGAFGDCEAVLGWAWTGAGCHEISGCDCGQYCESVFESESECVASCSPPVCCGDEMDCPSGLLCASGHCVLPPPEGSCYGDGDCGAGQFCGESQVCPCGDKYCEQLGIEAAKPGVCLDPPVCCEVVDGALSECSDNTTCVFSGFITPRCHPAVEFGSCWTAADCKSEEFCLGAEPCDCSETYCIPKAGSCTPKAEGCCTVDAECSDGLVCTAEVALPGNGVYFGKEVGACTTPPEPGQCFGDEYCAGDEQCVSWTGFSCGDEGLDFLYAGSCVPRDGACCTEGLECKEGYECAFTLPTSGKVCKPVPATGSCWFALDCEDGQACIGAETCGLCGPCEGAGTPGTCLDVDDPAAACCLSDDDCGEGEACTVAESVKSWSPPGVTAGQCVPAPAEPGTCFATAHCAPGDFCQGFAGHPCGMATTTPLGYATFYPGYCMVADGACCYAELDCPTGYHCAGLDTAGDSGVCKPEQADGSCWSNLDCGEGTCEGELLCGCKGCLDGEVKGVCQ